jgi:4-amino-4-deoxychorismate lyase
MATYLLKKSYRRKDLKEINFKDLWNSHGVFTTMWVFGKPNRILFIKQHIHNLIKSLKYFKLNEIDLENNIYKLIKLNIKKNKKYNHLLRIAVNKKIISISLRKKAKLKKNFNLNVIKYKRIKPEFKNLKYKKLLKHLIKVDITSSDIAIHLNNYILETATANLLFVRKNKIYSPINSFYKGITLKFFEKKINKIIKRNISLKSLSIYDEIILVGSGKGVVSIKSIKKLNWNRKSSKTYMYLSKIYQVAVTNCPRYYG